MNTMPALTEAELDARIRAKRYADDEAVEGAAGDLLDRARAADHPHWSDELDSIDRSTGPLRNVAMALIAVGLVGAIVVVTLSPSLWDFLSAAAAVLP